MNWQWSERRGRYAIPNPIPRNAPFLCEEGQGRSLGVHGAHVFNILPKSLRNENSADFPLFKNHLDIFLAMVPDQPTTTGLARPAASNSLLDQVLMVKDLDLDTFVVS